MPLLVLGLEKNAKALYHKRVNGFFIKNYLKEYYVI